MVKKVQRRLSLMRGSARPTQTCHGAGIRQVSYRSVTTASSGRAADDIPGILVQAVARNGTEGVTGVLYTEAESFLQSIEGPEESVHDLIDRLHADDRHRDMVILTDRSVDQREFGDWTMIHRDRREVPAAFYDRMRVLLAGVSPDTAEYFRRLRPA